MTGSYWIETETGRWTPTGLRSIPAGDVEIRRPVKSNPNHVILVGGKVIGTIRRTVAGPIFIVSVTGHEFRKKPDSMTYKLGVRFSRPEGFKTLAEAKAAALAVLNNRPKSEPPC